VENLRYYKVITGKVKQTCCRNASIFFAATIFAFSGLLGEQGIILFCYSIPEFICSHIHNTSDDTGNAFKVRIKDSRGIIEPFVDAW
jgi:hypothetical protein